MFTDGSEKGVFLSHMEIYENICEVMVLCKVVYCRIEINFLTHLFVMTLYKVVFRFLQR